MPRKKTPRENGRPRKKGWSDWSKALVPLPFDGVKNRAPGNHGYIVRDIERAFPYKARKCGIYEWKVEKPGGRSAVVYVGSTCRGKPGSLRDRINEYCNDGSHKSKLINDALRRGYSLSVRVKPARPSENVEELEKAFLDRYDYPWNKDRNGDIRPIRN